METPEEEVAAQDGSGDSPEQSKDFGASFEAAAKGEAPPPSAENEGGDATPTAEEQAATDAAAATAAADAKTEELATLQTVIDGADTPEAKGEAEKAFVAAGGKVEEPPTAEQITTLEQAVEAAEGDEATAAAQTALDAAKAKVPDASPAATAAETRAEELETEQANATYDRNMAVVSKARPQIADLLKDQAFFDWIDAQPTATRVQANADNPADVIELVDKYEAANATTPATNGATGDKGDLIKQLDAHNDVAIPGAGEGEPQTIKELRGEVGDNMISGLVTLMAQLDSGKTAALEAEIAELKAREYVKPADLQGLQQDVQQTKLYRGLRMAGHSDAEQIEASPEYKAWVGQSSKGMQKLAQSWESGDVALAMGAYKEKLAREAKAPADAEKGTTHRKKVDLHKETVSGGSNGGRGGDGDGEKTFESGFDESAKALAEEAKARQG